MTQLRTPTLAPVVLALAVAASLVAFDAWASKVRLLNLDEMTRRADRVFSGRCVAARTEKDEALGLEVTVLDFAVERVAKGRVGTHATIRQIRGDAAGVGGGAEIAGLPRFAAGEEVVVFLYGQSAAGLSSPVGLGQGKFTVRVGKDGRRLAVNEFGNAGLLRGVPASTRAQLGESLRRAEDDLVVSPGELLDIVDRLVAAE